MLRVSLSCVKLIFYVCLQLHLYNTSVLIFLELSPCPVILATWVESGWIRPNNTFFWSDLFRPVETSLSMIDFYNYYLFYLFHFFFSSKTISLQTVKILSWYHDWVLKQYQVWKKERKCIYVVTLASSNPWHRWGSIPSQYFFASSIHTVLPPGVKGRAEGVTRGSHWGLNTWVWRCNTTASQWRQEQTGSLSDPAPVIRMYQLSS